jgi:hypothetical protein
MHCPGSTFSARDEKDFHSRAKATALDKAHTVSVSLLSGLVNE